MKILSKIFTNCFKLTNALNSEETSEKSKNYLNISVKKIERVLNLYNSFEIVLEINKDKKSNNPTELIC